MFETSQVWIVSNGWHSKSFKRIRKGFESIVCHLIHELLELKPQ
jgi:hypothetical protein